MKIKVVSFIPYLEDINKVYEIKGDVSVENFVLSLGIKWDDDALVVVNSTIATDPFMLLEDGDVVQLLLPLSGG